MDPQNHINQDLSQQQQLIGMLPPPQPVQAAPPPDPAAAASLPVAAQPPAKKFDETSPTHAVLKFFEDRNPRLDPKTSLVTLNIRPVTTLEGALLLEKNGEFLKGKVRCEFSYTDESGQVQNHTLELDVHTYQLHSEVSNDVEKLRNLGLKMASSFSAYTRFHEAVIKAVAAQNPDAEAQQLAAKVDEIRQNGAVRISYGKPSGKGMEDHSFSPIKAEQWTDAGTAGISVSLQTAGKVDGLRHLIKDPADSSNYLIGPSTDQPKKGSLVIREQDIPLLRPPLQIGERSEKDKKIQQFKALKQGKPISLKDITDAGISHQDYIESLKTDINQARSNFEFARKRVLTNQASDEDPSWIKQKLGIPSQPPKPIWAASTNLAKHQKQEKAIAKLEKEVAKLEKKATTLDQQQELWEKQSELARLKKSFDQQEAEIHSAPPIMQANLKRMEDALAQLETLHEGDQSLLAKNMQESLKTDFLAARKTVKECQQALEIGKKLVQSSKVSSTTQNLKESLDSELAVTIGQITSLTPNNDAYQKEIDNTEESIENFIRKFYFPSRSKEDIDGVYKDLQKKWDSLETETDKLSEKLETAAGLDKQLNQYSESIDIEIERLKKADPSKIVEMNALKDTINQQKDILKNTIRTYKTLIAKPARHDFQNRIELCSQQYKTFNQPAQP